MKHRNPTRRVARSLSLAVLLFGMASGAAAETPLVVGWHDELNRLDGWKPLVGINAADVYAGRPGAMTLRMPHVPEGYPYVYQWGGATCNLSVDLERYPVLVARVVGMRRGSYAHVDIEERDFEGRTYRTLRSEPTLQGPGLTTADVGKAWGSHTRRLALRLIVGGRLEGASCEYAWVRFIRREDLPRLKEVPDLQTMDLKP